MRGTVLKLGAFTAVCLVFTMYLALTISNVRLSHLWPGRTYDLSATFDDVTGLLPGDQVKVAGVVVGKVTGISVDKGRARVSLQVRSSVRLPSDTEGAVRWRDLLGRRYVYLYPGDAATVLRDGDRIERTRAVVDLGELFNRLGPIVQAIDPAQVNTFLDAITGAIDGNEAALRQAIDDLASVAASLGTRDEAIGELVGNLDTVTAAIASRDAQIRAVLDNLLAVTRTFSENTDVLDAAITELGTVSDQLALLLGTSRTRLEGIIANLAVVTGVLDAKLAPLETAISNLDETGAALHRTSRYGEMLNQAIPCGRIGQPVVAEVPCAPALSGDQSSPSAGVWAIRDVLVGPR